MSGIKDYDRRANTLVSEKVLGLTKHLHLSIRHHMPIDRIRTLIEAGADPALYDEDGASALHWAAAAGSLAEVTLMLDECGMPVDVRDIEGNTPLIYSSEYGKADVAQILISRNADVNAVDRFNQPALVSAVRHGHTHMTTLLLEEKADPNIIDSVANWKPLIHCSSVSVFKLLIEQTTELNAKDINGQNALFGPAGNGRLEILQLLLRKDEVDINMVDKNGLSRYV